MSVKTSFDAKSLLSWFQKHARPLPWREHYRPYEVVLSEFMLQQTQVVTALPYYERWLKRWPDWKSLSCASEAEVLSCWEGLGYYQRARRLWGLAKHVVASGWEELPKQPDDLILLPGLGPYTSAAIASIAFNEVALPIDGNVRRVLSRYYQNGLTSPSKEQDTFFEDRLMPVMKRVKARRDLAQALMELGASHCSPRKPDCLNCPLQKTCAMSGPEEALSYPVKKARPKAEPLFIHYCWVQTKKGLLLRQRPGRGRFPLQWEPPLVEEADEKEGLKTLTKLFKEDVSLKPMSKKRRDFTKYKVTWCEYKVPEKLSLTLPGYQEVPLKQVCELNLIPLLAQQWQKRINDK